MRHLIAGLLGLTTILLAACAGVTPTISDPAEPLPNPPATRLPPTALPLPVTPPPTTPLPSNALIVFTKEGGYASTTVTVTVYQDGMAHLEASDQSASVDWSAPVDKFQALQALLNNAAFAALAYDPDPDLNCSDCYFFTTTALTPQGEKSLKYDQADLELDKTIAPQYEALLDLMLDIIKSAPATTVTSGPEATATPQPRGAGLPEDVLLIYNREGGFAYTNLTLTVHLNGEAELTSSSSSEARHWTLTATELADLQALLNDPGFAQLPFDKIVACDDCYVYTLTARTSQGVQVVKVDDADLSNAQWPLLQKIVNQLLPYLKA